MKKKYIRKIKKVKYKIENMKNENNNCIILIENKKWETNLQQAPKCKVQTIEKLCTQFGEFKLIFLK